MIAALLTYGSLVAVAWCGHTPRSRQLADHVADAIDDAQLSKQGAGIDMGLDTGGVKLSRQIAGLDPMNLWRLASLPDAFLIAFAKRILLRFGYRVMEPTEVDLILSAAHLGVKEMLKMAPSLLGRHRKVS